MASFNNITAESFAKESLQGEGRKRQRYREALSCLQCREKKVKVTCVPIPPQDVLQPDWTGSVTEIDHAISVNRARRNQNAHILRQDLIVPLKVKFLLEVLKIDNRLPASLALARPWRIFENRSVV